MSRPTNSLSTGGGTCPASAGYRLRHVISKNLTTPCLGATCSDSSLALIYQTVAIASLVGSQLEDLLIQRPTTIEAFHVQGSSSNDRPTPLDSLRAR